MKKTISSIFFALVLALCLLPSAGMLLFGESEAAANEILAFAPQWREKDGSVNRKFPGELADYVNDRFFLRQECVTAWNALNARLLRSSPAEGVVLGRDGWLYYADTLPDYTRSSVMNERELWCAARTVLLMQEYAESEGCRFLFTLAPNKNSLYPLFMPGLSVPDTASSAERFAAVVSEMGGNYLNLFSVFEKEDELLYYRTDSHWNGKGAALAADAILSALGKDGSWMEGGFVPGEAHRGDLYEMLYPAGTAAEADFAPAGGFRYTYTRSYRGPTDLRINTASEGQSGSLLCYRDSFGNNSFPYLAERFGTAVFSRANVYDLCAIAEYDADTVLIELVERNLRWLLENDPVFPAPERTETLDPVPLNVPIPVTVTEKSGLRMLSASLPTRPDDDSPLYLRCAGALYEATPREDGFCVCIGAEVPAEGAEIIYTSAGVCVSAALTAY